MIIVDSASIHILFLGTGAADWPSSYTASIDGRCGSVRGYSSVLVDGRVLIDCGSTVPNAIERFGADPSCITDILLTHTHCDHCDIDAIRHLASLRKPKTTINLRAHPSALSNLPEIKGVHQCPTEAGEAFSLASLTFTGLVANHPCGHVTALHYLFQNAKSSVLYATDGSWFLKKTWLYLKEHVLDAIIWDATCGESQGDWRIFEHSSVDMIRIQRQTLEREGVLPPHGRIFLTHMARTLCAAHLDMTERLTPEGLVPAYDGLEISIYSAEQSVACKNT